MSPDSIQANEIWTDSQTLTSQIKQNWHAWDEDEWELNEYEMKQQCSLNTGDKSYDSFNADLRKELRKRWDFDLKREVVGYLHNVNVWVKTRNGRQVVYTILKASEKGIYKTSKQ